jgi:hypothetical protein
VTRRPRTLRSNTMMPISVFDGSSRLTACWLPAGSKPGAARGRDRRHHPVHRGERRVGGDRATRSCVLAASARANAAARHHSQWSSRGRAGAFSTDLPRRGTGRPIPRDRHRDDRAVRIVPPRDPLGSVPRGFAPDAQPAWRATASAAARISSADRR